MSRGGGSHSWISIASALDDEGALRKLFVLKLNHHREGRDIVRRYDPERLLDRVRVDESEACQLNF